MVGQQFTAEERSFIALEYHKVKGQYNCINKVKESFVMKFPNSIIPVKNTIKRIWKKQNTWFTVHNLNSKTSPGVSYSGRLKSARTPENIEAVKNILDNDASKAVDDDSVNTARKNELGLDKSSWSRIAKLDLKYHSYKLVVSQKLKPEDLQRRLAFAHNILDNTTPADTAHTAFSDEATFNLDGEINTQNTRRYAPKKVRGEDIGGRPQHFRHEKTKYPQKLMVFLGVYGDGSTWGLKILEKNTTMDGDMYY